MAPLVDEFIQHLQQEYSIEAAMLLGSTEGTDIEICCIGDSDPIRTVQVFKQQRIRYEISAFDTLAKRLEQDGLAMRRFSYAQVMFDAKERGAQLVTMAQAKRAVYTVTTPQDWLDAELFLAEERCATAADLFAGRQISEASIIAGKVIWQLVEILRRWHNQLPLDEKHLLKELGEFDSNLVVLVDAFWQQPSAARLQRIYQHVARQVRTSA